MDKKIIISLVTAAVVVGGVIWYFNSNSSYPSYNPPAPAPTPAQTSGNQTAEPTMPPVPTPAPISANAGAIVAIGKITVDIPPGAASPANSDNAYSPANITIKKGSTVTWLNQDSVKHTVTSDSGTTLNSPYFGQGETWSYTFNVVGKYSYHCIPHPWMKGTVTVVD